MEDRSWTFNGRQAETCWVTQNVVTELSTVFLRLDNALFGTEEEVPFFQWYLITKKGHSLHFSRF